MEENIQMVSGGGPKIQVTHNLDNFGLHDYDYFSVAYPNPTTEVYSFFLGGASGRVVNTITLVYTDSTKANLSSGTKG